MSKTVTSRDVHGASYRVATEDLQWRPSVYAIVVRDGKILLSKQHGGYHLPGGGLEFGESLEQALIREVREETGIAVSDPRLRDCISGYFTWTTGQKEYHHQTILLFYECTFVGGELSIDGLEEDEKPNTEMPEWVPVEKLDNIAAGGTEDWRAVVKKALST